MLQSASNQQPENLFVWTLREQHALLCKKGIEEVTSFEKRSSTGGVNINHLWAQQTSTTTRTNGIENVREGQARAFRAAPSRVSWGYRPSLPIDAFGEWGRSEAMLGWRDGSRTDIREPRRSWPWSSLLSRSSDTFIRRGFGVLKMVRLSRQRALLAKNKKNVCLSLNRSWS